jgi:hypothetical protein
MVVEIDEQMLGGEVRPILPRLDERQRRLMPGAEMITF